MRNHVDVDRCPGVVGPFSSRAVFALLNTLPIRHNFVAADKYLPSQTRQRNTICILTVPQAMDAEAAGTGGSNEGI